MSDTSDIFNKLSDIAAKARDKGASDVKLSTSRQESLSANVRLGDLEGLGHSLSVTTSIKVYMGKKTGTATADSLRPSHLEMALEEALFNAQSSTEDPYEGLVDSLLLPESYPSPDVFDPSVPSPDQLIADAQAAEETALAVDRIETSGGASAFWGKSSFVILASNGFSGHSEKSTSGFYVSVVAGNGQNKKTSHAGTQAIYRQDIDDPQIVGKEAARRTIEQLNEQEVKSGHFPVVFDQRVAGSLMSNFIAAISGNAISKQQSFIRDMLGKQVLNSSVTLIDDPLLDRSCGSRAFDMDGFAARPLTIVENGSLKSWILGSYNARELSAKTGQHFDSTGHNGVKPNLYMLPGALDPAALIADIKDGFYVTGLMGGGGDIITGDYSRGAYGLWIKDGKPSFAVSKVTLAGHLSDIFRNIVPANNVNRARAGESIPTLRVDQGLKLGAG